MARPAFAGRRARSRFGQLAAFGGVVMLVSGALAVLGGAILPMLDAGSRTLVAQSGATAAAMRIETRVAADPTAQDDTIRAALSTALRDVPAQIVRTLSVDTDVMLDEPVSIQFTADPGLPEVAGLTSGAWPASPDDAAILDAAAARSGIALGDTLTLGDRVVTITGIWHPTDSSAARWFGDPAVASGAEKGAFGPVLVDESVLTGLADTPVARWTMVPDPSALGVAALPREAAALARLDAEVRRMGGGDTAVSLLGTLDDTVARATRVTAVSTGVLGLPLVLVVVAGAIVLALIARAIASGRGGEFVLLRARGASLRALAAAAARESALTAAIGAAVGAGIAVAVLHFGLPLIGATGDAAVPLAIAIAAGVAVLAVVLATIVTVAELRAPVTGRAESGRAAVIASLGPLALAAVAAGLALAQFLTLGSPVLIGSDGIVRTDPVALTAPVLVLLTGALAAPAIAGPIVAVAERFARAGRGILPVLPLRQLARRTRSVAAGVLVIALAAGALVLAVGFQQGATAARLHAEQASTGADLRVAVPVRSSVEDGAPGASSASFDGVAAVDGAFAVLASTASVGADAVPLVAADAEKLAGVRSAPPELAPFVPDLTAMRGGAEIPGGTTQLTVAADLSPGDGVPADLSVDVLLWMADRDGAALRVPLGSVPIVAGPVQLTGVIPVAATRLLAVEFRPPSLPEHTVVDIVFTSLTSPQGDAIGFNGASTSTLTSSKAERFLPQPGAVDPLPVVIGQEFAARLGLSVGSTFGFRVATVPAPIPANVVGIVPSLPGESDSLGILLDLPTLEGRAVELDGSVPAANQIWATSPDPDAAAAGVRTVLTVRSEIVTPRTFSAGPVIDPTVALVALGVAVTALLAILGFAAVAASISQRRRTELTPLRSLGLSAARIRSARAIELVATAVLAVLLGAAAGLATAALVVPGLAEVLA